MDKNSLIKEIITLHKFENKKIKFPNFCPCFKTKKCHNIENLNCLFCYCPEYKKEINEGGCKINSVKGKWFYHQNHPTGRIWDCSDCTIPHTEEYIKNKLENFSLEDLKKLLNSSI